MYKPQLFKSNSPNADAKLSNALAKLSENELKLKYKRSILTDLNKALNHSPIDTTNKYYISMNKLREKTLEEINDIEQKLSNNARNQAARIQAARNQAAKYKFMRNSRSNKTRSNKTQSNNSKSQSQSQSQLQKLQSNEFKRLQEEQYNKNMERAIALSTGNQNP
jgi:hypothetical protein